MQAVISFFHHLALALLVIGHSILAVVLPHPNVTTFVISHTATSTPEQTTKVISLTEVKTSTSTGLKPAQQPLDETKVPRAGSASASSTSITIPTSPSTISSPVLSPSLSVNTVDTLTRAALVNILCTTKSGGSFEPISGSGVMIATNGVILTNAHVGQYFLLRDYLVSDNVDCVVRTGSPASTKYHARLLYLPPAWIAANASQIGGEGRGTGENDYSFLLITSSTDPSVPLPTNFPALTMTTDDPVPGESTVLAGYPAGFLGGQSIQLNLYITSAVAAIENVFTFNNQNTADVISVPGTAVSQAGASGGAIVRLQDAALQGIVATDTDGATTATRDLHGISVSYINRSLINSGMGGLITLLSGDLLQKAQDFQTNVAPGEEKQLFDVLQQSQ